MSIQKTKRKWRPGSSPFIWHMFHWVRKSVSAKRATLKDGRNLTGRVSFLRTRLVWVGGKARQFQNKQNSSGNPVVLILSLLYSMQSLITFNSEFQNLVNLHELCWWCSIFFWHIQLCEYFQFKFLFDTFNFVASLFQQ